MSNQFFKLLETLYAQMDHAWDDIAAQYSFICNGCDDNCCKSLFFHHTHIEKQYLLLGFSKLSNAVQKSVIEKSENYYNQTFLKNNGQGEQIEEKFIVSKKIFCPANTNGNCILYPYRPMICRLHGVPHEVKKPGTPIITSPGCQAGGFDAKSYQPFDRTQFYREMAQIEMNYRQHTLNYSKIKESIAQMLMPYKS